MLQCYIRVEGTTQILAILHLFSVFYFLFYLCVEYTKNLKQENRIFISFFSFFYLSFFSFYLIYIRFMAESNRSIQSLDLFFTC